MSSAELHRFARPLILRGLDVHELPHVFSVVLAVHAVGWLETRYGTAWLGAGKGSKNWGAIQSGPPPCPVAKSFEYTDTNPNADGTSTPYRICFRKYPTDEEGAADLVRIELVRRPRVLDRALAGDFYGVSNELYKTHYYTGFGPTPAARVANHYKALSSAIRSAATALGEAVPDLPPPPAAEPWQDDYLPDNPLILKGSYGPYVKVWQRILNTSLEERQRQALAVDGAFGKYTAAETKLWQKAHALKVDGKVGKKTWEAAALEAA